MTARPMTEACADELLDDFEQAVSDRAEDGMCYRPRVDGPRDEAREALRAALLSTSSAERGMREALIEARRYLDAVVANSGSGKRRENYAGAVRRIDAALSAHAGEDEQATRGEDAATKLDR